MIIELLTKYKEDEEEAKRKNKGVRPIRWEKNKPVFIIKKNKKGILSLIS